MWINFPSILTRLPVRRRITFGSLIHLENPRSTRSLVHSQVLVPAIRVYRTPLPLAHHRFVSHEPAIRKHIVPVIDHLIPVGVQYKQEPLPVNTHLADSVSVPVAG